MTGDTVRVLWPDESYSTYTDVEHWSVDSQMVRIKQGETRVFIPFRSAREVEVHPPKEE